QPHRRIRARAAQRAPDLSDLAAHDGGVPALLPVYVRSELGRLVEGAEPRQGQRARRRLRNARDEGNRLGGSISRSYRALRSTTPRSARLPDSAEEGPQPSVDRADGRLEESRANRLVHLVPGFPGALELHRRAVQLPRVPA